MSYQGFPESTVETPFGTVRVWATSATHVGIDANGPINIEDRRTIKVNGVEMTMRFDFSPTEQVRAQKSSPWEARDAEAAGLPWAVAYQGTMTRCDNWKSASDAARRKVRAWALAWVNGFVTTEAGKELLAKGQAAHLNNKGDSLRSAIEQKESELAELRAELRQVERDDRFMTGVRS